MKTILQLLLLTAGAVALRAQTFPTPVASAVTIDANGNLLTGSFSSTTTSAVNLSKGVVTLSGTSLLNAMVAGGGTSISQSGGILYIYSSGGGGGGGDAITLSLSGLTGNVGGSSNSSAISLSLSPPTTGTLGGLFSNAGTTHQWVHTINTDGSVTMTQPAASDISGLGSAATSNSSAFLTPGNDLSDLGSASTARGNLGLGSAAVSNSSAFLTPGNNLSDVGSAATARTNLGLGSAATSNSSAFLTPSHNLSDIGSAATARTNLGLGSASTVASSSFLQAANNLSDLASLGAARTALNIQYPSGSHFLFSAISSGGISVTSSFTSAPFVAQTDPYSYFGNANLGASGSYSTAYVCPVSGPVLFGSQINDLGGGTSGSRIIEALFEEGSLVAVTFDWELPVSSTDTHMASCTIWNATAGKRYQMETLSGTGSFSVYTGSVFYAQQASPLSARFTAAKVFNTLASAYVSSCSFTFTGTFSGQTGFYPDCGGVVYTIMDVRDVAAAIRYAPANFTASQIANIIAMYGQGQVVSIAASAGAGIPECINPDSTFGVVGDHAPDSTHIPDLDGIYDWVDLMYSHFLKTGSATQYATYSASVSAGLSSNTIDNHLVKIATGSIGPPGWGFQDSEDIRGHDLFTSVERYRAYQEIAAMVAANSGDPSSWNAELPLITAALDSNLFDGTSNLFLTCDTATQSNNVPNIPGSCYAVYIGAASTTSSAAIVAACHNGYTGNAGDLAGHGFTYGGQVRHMPRGSYFSTFRSSGTADTYQDGGYWMFFAPWYAYCLAKNDVTEAEEFMNEAANFSLAVPAVGAVESYGPQANAYLGAHKYLDSATAPLGYFNGIQK